MALVSIAINDTVKPEFLQPLLLLLQQWVPLLQQWCFEQISVKKVSKRVDPPVSHDSRPPPQGGTLTSRTGRKLAVTTAVCKKSTKDAISRTRTISMDCTRYNCLKHVPCCVWFYTYQHAHSFMQLHFRAYWILHIFRSSGSSGKYSMSA